MGDLSRKSLNPNKRKEKRKDEGADITERREETLNVRTLGRKRNRRIPSNEHKYSM